MTPRGRWLGQVNFWPQSSVKCPSANSEWVYFCTNIYQFLATVSQQKRDSFFFNEDSHLF